MQIILIAALAIALLGAFATIVMSPKPSQRAIALIVTMLAVFFIGHTIVLLLHKESEAWNYGRNIQPTNTLLSIVSEDIKAGRYEQAKSRLDRIAAQWRRIRARPDAYSAGDILREIQENQAGETTDAESRDYSGPSHGDKAPK